LGITQKELFDEIIFDPDCLNLNGIGQPVIPAEELLKEEHFKEELLKSELRDPLFNAIKEESKRIKEINRFYNSLKEHSIRKTFVISRGALLQLNKLANEIVVEEKITFTRDELLAFCVFEKKNQIKYVTEETRKSYQYAKEIIEEISEDLTELLKSANWFFDDVRNELSVADNAVKNALKNITEFLEIKDLVIHVR
jgi:uncharacterized protein YoxC